VLAQVIVCLMIMACIRAYRHNIDRSAILNLPPIIYPLMWIAMLAVLAQLLLGTQVREAIDVMAKQNDFTNRHLWISSLPIVSTLASLRLSIVDIHKYLSMPVVIFTLWFANRICVGG